MVAVLYDAKEAACDIVAMTSPVREQVCPTRITEGRGGVVTCRFMCFTSPASSHHPSRIDNFPHLNCNLTHLPKHMES